MKKLLLIAVVMLFGLAACDYYYELLTYDGDTEGYAVALSHVDEEAEYDEEEKAEKENKEEKEAKEEKEEKEKIEYEKKEKAEKEKVADAAEKVEKEKVADAAEKAEKEKVASVTQKSEERKAVNENKNDNKNENKHHNKNYTVVHAPQVHAAVDVSQNFIGQTVILRADGRYISARRNYKDSPLRVYASKADTWEHFAVVAAPDGQVALRAAANNKYVSAVRNASNVPLRAVAGKSDSWEHFRIFEYDGGFFLQASNGQWVTTCGKSNDLRASAKDFSGATWFTIR